MKKPIIAIILLLILALLLTVMIYRSTPSNPTDIPSNTPASSVSSASEETPDSTPDPSPTSDPRNEEPVVREEIAKMLRDAKELIQEGLMDDAGRILRDLRTRELTEEEKSQVDALQAVMTKVKD